MIESGSIRELADAIKGSTAKADTGSTVGATVIRTAPIWVRVNGSETSTPIASSTVAVAVGDRVSVRIEGGTATITGNLSNVSTGAVETARAVEPVAIVAQSAFEASELAQANAERAKESAQTAHSAAQDAVKSASDAGRAAAVAQAAMGSTTVDWHDYTVQVGEDGQWHAFDKNGAEVPLSEISMVYQDALGMHIIGESTRMDVGSDSLDIVDSSNDGSVVARFSPDGAFIGKHGSGRISLDHSSIDLVTYSEDGEVATTTISNYDDSGRHVTHIGKNNGSGIDVVYDTTRDFPTDSASLTSGICASVECFDSNMGAGFDGYIKAKARRWEEGYEEESCLAVYPDGVVADCNVESKSLTVDGKPLLKTDTCTSPTSSISNAGTLQATIPTHDGYTPIAIAGFTNTANALAVLRAYINGSTAVLAVRNMASSATSGTATFTILYAANGVF